MFNISKFDIKCFPWNIGYFILNKLSSISSNISSVIIFWIIYFFRKGLLIIWELNKEFNSCNFSIGFVIVFNLSIFKMTSDVFVNDFRVVFWFIFVSLLLIFFLFGIFVFNIFIFDNWIFSSAISFSKWDISLSKKSDIFNNILI